MRKIALMAAIALAAVFANPSSSIAATDAEWMALNKDAHNFVRDAWNPWAASSAPAKAPKKAKMAKKKSKK